MASWDAIQLVRCKADDAFAAADSDAAKFELTRDVKVYHLTAMCYDFWPTSLPIGWGSRELCSLEAP